MVRRPYSPLMASKASAIDDQRQQEAEERDEGRQRLARGGEQAQEQERILADRSSLIWPMAP